MELKDLVMFDPDEHVYWVYGDKPIMVPSTTQLMKHVGIISDFKIPMHYAERGTEVHEQSESVDDGSFKWDEATERSKPYLHAYNMFLNENDLEFITSEEMVFHKDLFYAGTLDRHWRVNGLESITDLKTGGHATWHGIQLAAYHSAKGLSRKVQLANLYLTPYEYKFKILEPIKADYAFQALAHMSWCYWATRRRDYDRLKGLALELGSKPTAKDDFFFN